MSRRPNEKAVTDFVRRRWPDHEPPRAYVLDLWEHFNQRRLAKGNFVSDFTSGNDAKLFQRLWEMVLARHLIEQGFALQSNDPGPDFLFELDGKKVWIEAIAPASSGLSKDWLEKRGVIDVPVKEILLRWTSAFSAKKEKFSEYLDKGIVESDDICVIAISGHLLNMEDPRGSSGQRYAAEAVFPIGPLAVDINRQTGEHSNLYNSERWSERKPRGADVPTDSFLNQENRYISAIVGNSHLWKSVMSRYDMAIVHNPFADNPFPRKRFGAEAEYVCEVGESEYIILDIQTEENSHA